MLQQLHTHLYFVSFFTANLFNQKWKTFWWVYVTYLKKICKWHFVLHLSHNFKILFVILWFQHLKLKHYYFLMGLFLVLSNLQKWLQIRDLQMLFWLEGGIYAEKRKGPALGRMAASSSYILERLFRNPLRTMNTFFWQKYVWLLVIIRLKNPQGLCGKIHVYVSL